MNYIKNTLALVGIAALISITLGSYNVSAYDVLGDTCAGGGGGNAVCAAQGEDVNDAITNITNTMLFLLGAVAVISIIIGGFMYATAAGDAGKVKNAKNTILYSVIGLVVALLAWGIVSFTVTNVG